MNVYGAKDLIIPIPFLRVCLAIIWIFRHFPLLLKCVYNDLAFLVPSIKDVFQHLYNSILNAVLLGRAFIVDKVITKKSPLNLIPMDMIIPKPVAMYYELIADLILPNDDLICVNVPEGGIPKYQVSQARHVYTSRQF